MCFREGPSGPSHFAHYYFGGGVTLRKVCRQCNLEKPIIEFNRRSRAADGLESKCRECQRAYLRKYWAENPDKRYYRSKKTGEYDKARWPKRRLARYGMTPEDYEELLVRQGGRCAICLRVPIQAFRIDHDHSCCPPGRSCGKCVRGLLCLNCNSAIGQLGEDRTILLRALDYLAG